MQYTIKGCIATNLHVSITLLRASIQGGYTRNIQRWLKSHRRNVDHCRDGEEGGTALHWAAYHGWLDIVKMLIENGASMGLRADIAL